MPLKSCRNLPNHGPKAAPIRRKTDLAADATPYYEIRYGILGSFFQAILCDLHSAIY
jgi:hypothetical protein